ncbi:carbohydrate kinase family protein [Bacillus sp. FJAT-29790]|uniref:carbohydrate kinase family protein n=1 Tax=Bacillus sp. FJAT-29790 TaxID=1895002 RepID=UPI001C236FFF|nr:carbohydrate kinase family protein [Bacillus sp. FJAT-29790]MBU8880439.1 carbohydrate kinase family protein [Bacillus sp. FJAT-29790]
MRKIAVHGFINADLIGLVDQFSEVDQEVEFKDLQITPGGSAANVAVGLSRLGEEVYFLGAVGEDANTSFLLESLEKVRLDYVQKVTGVASGTAIALVDNMGLRTMYTYPGANLKYDPSQIPASFSENVGFLHLSSPNLNLAKSFLEWKEKNKNLKISLDPSTLLTKKGLLFLEPLLSKSDILFLNRSEINDLFPDQEIDKAIQSLHEFGIEQIFVKLGKDGALSSFSSEGMIEHLMLPSLKVEAIDSTGSGDAFAVGVLYGIMRGWSQESILQTGINLGGQVVSQIGARKGLPFSIE